uniref:Uncharacterized protein n=1 Tax=Cacopsylla melanoneura TaxID=428564 RepID=A0A8D8SU71_9HEMI
MKNDRENIIRLVTLLFEVYGKHRGRHCLISVLLTQTLPDASRTVSSVLHSSEEEKKRKYQGACENRHANVYTIGCIRGWCPSSNIQFNSFVCVPSAKLLRQ